MNISPCPRCGGAALEHLITHSTCLECGFSPEADSDLNLWERLETSAIRRRPESNCWILRRELRMPSLFA